MKRRHRCLRIFAYTKVKEPILKDRPSNPANLDMNYDHGNGASFIKGSFAIRRIVECPFHHFRRECHLLWRKCHLLWHSTAGSYQITQKDALARSQREYRTLTTLADYDHVVLWFEHDSYDQLILAFLMDFIAATRPATRIELISVDDVPGIDRFIGLGQLSPEILIWLLGKSPCVANTGHAGRRMSRMAGDQIPRSRIAEDFHCVRQRRPSPSAPGP